MTIAPSALVLASASPRRRELLSYFGVPFHALATDAEEQDIMPPDAIIDALPQAPVALRQHPTLLAWRKANAACASAPGGVIIGADTIVALDGDVLNKPAGPEEARTMLRRLAGRRHTVFTGLAVLRQTTETATSRRSTIGRWAAQFGLVASEVTLDELSDDAIAAYVATGEPLDKAGAYGIQGLGGRLVRRVVGSYTNVVGLPLPDVHRLLAAAGVGSLAEPSDAYQRWLRAQGKEPLPCPPTFP
jgi:septum formation protein